MKFLDFLNEIAELSERASTSHSRVEMALRAANLEYKKSVQSTRTLFDIDNSDYHLYSYNNGKVDLMKYRVKGVIASVDISDNKDIVAKISKLLDKVK